MTKWKLEALPLLTTFQALMDHGGVTEAAAALSLTQSAVSKQLAKMREAYDDPLFIRTGSGMRPTPRAIWMSEHVATILAEAEALSLARPFSPADLHGIVTVSTTDEIGNTLLQTVLPQLRKEAPRLRLTIVPLASDYSLDELETGRVDLVISVNWHAPDVLKQTRLFNDQFTCIMGRDHVLAEREWSVRDYADTEHILIAPLGMPSGRIDEALASQDLKRSVRVSVPVFRQLDPEVLGADLIATVPARVARMLDLRYPGRLVIRELPFEVPEISYFSMWHARFDKDPRHVWLRHLIRNTLV